MVLNLEREMRRAFSQRENSEGDGGEGHDDGSGEKKRNREFLVISQVYSGESYGLTNVAGVSGLTGKPVVICPRTAACASWTEGTPSIFPASAKTGRTPK